MNMAKSSRCLLLKMKYLRDVLEKVSPTDGTLKRHIMLKNTISTSAFFPPNTDLRQHATHLHNARLDAGWCALNKANKQLSKSVPFLFTSSSHSASAKMSQSQASHSDYSGLVLFLKALSRKQ